MKLFPLTIKKFDSKLMRITVIGTKSIYNAVGCDTASWIRQEIRRLSKIPTPNLSSAVVVRHDSSKTTVRGGLGCLNNNSNNVYKNGTDVFLVSSCSSLNANVSIIPTNFRKVVALFLARKSIVPNWINCKDEYLVPNEQNPDYEQWVNDAIVYSLFNNSSQQSSLRQVTYKGKQWDIHNQFFWMPNAKMRQLANRKGFVGMYRDAKRFPEDAYVWKVLQDTLLSPDAQEVLLEAESLISRSMARRKQYHRQHPEYHLNAWDAGWAQLKPMFKEHFAEHLKAFVQLYKEMENRLRKGVYDFGFLRK
jgi:hypothetical protein